MARPVSRLNRPIARRVRQKWRTRLSSPAGVTSTDGADNQTVKRQVAQYTILCASPSQCEGEASWSRSTANRCLRRGIKGTYICPSPEHLASYVDEQVFRFNHREDSDWERFDKAMRLIVGKRLTYSELTDGAVR